MSTQKKTIPEFLLGGGEMGERMRNFDWEKTSLGAPEHWNRSLKTCVRIMLTSSQPIWIGWGKELIKLYNDPYRSIVGGKHPNALGQPVSIVWKDIWKDIGPLLKKTLETNEGTYSESQLLIMERNGYPEETYYTFSYTPIAGDKGETEGIFCANTEDTGRVIHERFLKTFQGLGTLSNKKNLEEIYITAAEVLEKNAQDFPCSVVYQIKNEGESAIAVACVGFEADHPELPKTINLKKPGIIGERLAKCVTENRMILSETKGRWQNVPKGAWDIGARHFVHVPIYGLNKKIPVAVLTTALNPYRKFDEQYQNFVQLITDQISLEVNNVMTYNQERKRAESLAELDRAKTLFFTNISHEFRTPLTLMLGPLEELLNQQKTHLSKNEQQNIETSHRNARRLLKLVNTLLDFSSIESGRQKAAFSQVDIVSFTKNLASNFSSVMENAGLKFIVKTHVINQPVYIDKEMWEKIVLNLLSNAFKYTLKGKITVELFSQKDHLKLTVKDTGAGIPENELPRMFDRFHRVQNSKGRTYEGTGIGLSLIKELVLLHGGRIDVESKIGVGTSFTVTIPFGKEHLPPSQIQNASAEDDTYSSLISTTFIEEAKSFLIPQSKQSVASSDYLLIVDDNVDMRVNLDTLLSTKYSVVTAVNGVDALKKINESKPVLILSDIMMPVIDGIELLKEVKSNPETAQIPFILLSARAGEEARIEGFEIGADDYLIKPFSAKELLARVASHIRLAREHQLIEEKLSDFASEQADKRKIIEVKKNELQNLFLNAPVSIVAYSAENFLVETANLSALKMWGKTEQEVINKPFFEVSPELKERMEPILQNVLNSGKTFLTYEYAVEYNRNGQMHSGYFDFCYQPIFNEENKVTGIISIGTEVTERVVGRKKIEEDEIRARIALEAGQLGTFEIDLIHESIIFSDRFAVIFGLNAEKKGTHDDLKKAIHPDDLTVRNKAFEVALKTGTLHYEVRVIWPDNSVHWIRTHGKVRYEKENAKCIYGIAEDITDEKIANLQLKESEQRVHVLNEQLSYELEATKELQRVSAKFIRSDDKNQLFESLLESAMKLMKSDFASIQIYDEKKNELVLYGNKNFHPESAVFWKTVLATSSSSCSEALINKKRIVVNDVEESEFMKGTEDLKYYRLSGIRAVQSTPLISRNGNFVGMISTHWKNVHYPTVNDLKFFDLLARQASDLIVQKVAEEAMSESEQRFRTVTQTLPQFIWTTDSEGLVDYFNPQWYHYTGSTPEQSLGNNWPKYLHADDVEKTLGIWNRSLETGETLAVELRIMAKDGTFKWFIVNGNPIKNDNGNITKWLGSFTDIHEQKTELNRTNWQLNKKDEFISIASHEMKTPLTTAKAYLELLELSLDETANGSKILAKKANFSIRRLNNLITELLDVSKIQSGKLDYNVTFFDFNEMVDADIEDSQYSAPKHQIIKCLSVSKKVNGDRDRLQQVVINLLSNGIKYSPHSKEVFIDVTEEGEFLKVCVKDNGVGIPKTHLEKIFERYYRVEENAVQFQGLGIGLFISNEIIQRHHGRLWAESEIGKGSSFYFTLPLS